MEINKTSAQKIDNNVQVAQATTTKPAVKTAEGTSFKDAVSMMSDIDAANNAKTDVKPANTTETAGKTVNSTKDFQFISTTENKTSFDKTLNKENLSASEKLNIHQKAEKELVKEIVLVNNKQVELKSNKNENQMAQVSTAIKSDKEIETEKNDKSKLNREHSKDSDLLDLSSNNRNQESNLNDNNGVSNDIDIIDNGVTPDNKAASTIARNDKDIEVIGSTASADVKNLDIVEDDLVIDKNDAQNELPIDIDIINNGVTPDNKAASTIARNNKDIEVIGSTASADVKNLDIVEDDLVIDKNDAQNELPIDIDIINNGVTPDNKAASTIARNNKDIEVIGSTASADVKNLDIVEDDLVSNVTKNNTKNNLSQNNFDFDKLGKNSEKLNAKTEVKGEVKSTTNKGITGNKSNSKVDNDVKIIKDIAQEVGDITPEDAVKLNKNDTNSKDMKVITFAPISPVQELKENLTTNKTNDIVKFIDANLETASSKKTSKSNSASAAKKAEEKAIKMTEADAKFFQNLVENNSQVAQDAKATDMANQATLKDIEETHSAKVSKSLLNALKESQETNKSFRVDFDKNLSVILKVNRAGKISAEFLPGDAAVEQYLKSNIPLLKQKFNDEGLEYENLSYRDQSRKDKEEKRNNRNNKENGYE